MHIISILFPLSSAFAGIPLQLYNFKGAMCYIEPSPWQCLYSKTVSCTRNKNSLLFEFLFGGLWLIIITSFVIILMALIYWSVRKRQRTMNRFNFRTRDGTVVPSSSYVQLCRDKRETGIQALLYVSAFICTYIWIGINYCYSLDGSTPDDALRLLIFFFQPLQGLWNFFIYIRPRYSVISTQYTHKSFWDKLVVVIFYPEVGRRPSAIERRRQVYPRVLNGLHASSSFATYRQNTDKAIEVKQDHDVEKGQSMAGNQPRMETDLIHPKSCRDSIVNSDHVDPSTLENNSVRESVLESSVSILTSRMSDHPISSNSATLDNVSMISFASRRILRAPVASEESADDDHHNIGDHWSEVLPEIKEESSTPFTARRRKTLFSTSVEDDKITDDSLVPLSKNPTASAARRKSLISIALDDMDLILADDDGSL
jgi:hypothetical protein